MVFLIDAQLPPSIAQFVVAQGHEANHVSDVGLQEAKDNEFWNYAEDQNSLPPNLTFALANHMI